MFDRIAIPDDIYGRVEKAANAEGDTVEALVMSALERASHAVGWSKSGAKGRLIAGA